MGIELHRRYSLVTLAYMAGIFLLSSIPGSGAESNRPIFFRFAWNLLHIPVYAGLTFCFAQAVAGGMAGGTPRWGPYWLAFWGTTAYAVFDEWHQSFVRARYASVGDVLLDCTGVLGMLAFLRLRAGREVRW